MKFDTFIKGLPSHINVARLILASAFHTGIPYGKDDYGLRGTFHGFGGKGTKRHQRMSRKARNRRRSK